MIILSSLGTGTYREANYKSDHHDEVVTTGLFANALQKWYPDAQVRLLVTKTAREGENGKYVRKNHPNFQLVDIPEGKTEAEAWKLFECIAEHIPDGEQVIFDITHGLRSLPMLGFLALSYLKVVKKIDVAHVYYGALDLTPRGGDRPLTPVIELTPLVSLLDWAQAVNRFQDTGDARLFRPLMSGPRDPSLSKVAGNLEQLSVAFANNRTLDVGNIASQLKKSLEQARQTPFVADHSPFLSVIDNIDRSISPLQKQEDARLSLLAQHAQIVWYEKHGHAMQAIGLLREWLVSVVSWHQTGEIQLTRDERSEIEKLLNKHRKEPHKAVPELQKVVKLWDKVVKLRNDLSHFGMRDQRIQGQKVRGRVENAMKELVGAVRPLGLELEEAEATHKNEGVE